MKILSLETGAAQWGAACVECDEQRGEARLLGMHTSSQTRELSQQLFAGIESTLSAASWRLEDVEAIAVGIGPGSWTGLRIGLSAAKTLAQARGWPIAGVPSFDGEAQAIWRARMQEHAVVESTLLLATGPCRPGEIYAKVYEAGEDYLGVLQSEWIGSPKLVANTLQTQALARGIEAPPLLAGGAATAVAELLETQRQEYFLVGASFDEYLSELAVAGATKIAGGEADDALSLQPLYLAPSNAERNLLAR
jgi:tRNA threonylcarbamoyladenosine biosynthesis protein TsaB